ncbi:MAG: thioredoxin family protein [Candidatus Dadabacteria bacterium]|nr:MAG: thioredoxin family protein [Candidatus Dadabacteria bacterium]
MALLESAPHAEDFLAPDFRLRDVIWDRDVSRDEVAGPHGMLVMFMCNHCPYVQRILDGIVAVGRDYQQSGVGIVAINPNDPAVVPEDSPERMRQLAHEKRFTFPYLFDPSQDTARAYGAVCTPEFMLFDRDLRLVWHGQFDDARPGNDRPVTGRDLRAALDALCLNRPIPEPPARSVGCSIKWRPA